MHSWSVGGQMPLPMLSSKHGNWKIGQGGIVSVLATSLQSVSQKFENDGWIRLSKELDLQHTTEVPGPTTAGTTPPE